MVGQVIKRSRGRVYESGKGFKTVQKMVSGCKIYLKLLNYVKNVQNVPKNYKKWYGYKMWVNIRGSTKVVGGLRKWQGSKFGKMVGVSSKMVGGNQKW